MRVERIIWAATIITSILIGVGLAFAAPALAGGCPKTTYISIGGTGDPGSVFTPGIPRGVNRINITYPADVWQGDYSRHVAATKLDRTARQLRASCPGMHLSIRAFSLGASAASLSTDGWIGTPLSRNTDAVLYGNPRKPGSAFGGIETVGLPNLPNYTWRGPHRQAWWIRNVCHGGDGVCRSPRPLHANLGAAWNGLYGYATTAHRY